MEIIVVDIRRLYRTRPLLGTQNHPEARPAVRIAIDIDPCVCIEGTNSDEAIAEGRPYAHAVESVNGWYDAGHDTHIASHRAQRSLTATRRWPPEVLKPAPVPRRDARRRRP
jgi:hypothetical protein